MRRTLGSRFLVVYSAIVTIAFMLTTYFGFVRPVHGESTITEFDRIRAHRIDLVEPDGTVRLILSNRADYPGSFYHGKEIARPDRNDSAGLLFINDEGTEDGGLIFGGRLHDGNPMSFSHLSFDQYEQDQTLALESFLTDGKRYSGLALKDMPDFALTPAVMDEVERVKTMPHDPARAAAWAALQKKYQSFGTQRASLARDSDGSVGLTLRDDQGHPRLRLTVDRSGTPSFDMLNSEGRIIRHIDPTTPESHR
jgi:hypothetical protein